MDVKGCLLLLWNELQKKEYGAAPEAYLQFVWLLADCCSHSWFCMEDADQTANSDHLLSESRDVRFQSKSCTFGNMLVSALRHDLYFEANNIFFCCVALFETITLNFSFPFCSQFHLVREQTPSNHLTIGQGVYIFFPHVPQRLPGACWLVSWLVQLRPKQA